VPYVIRRPQPGEGQRLRTVRLHALAEAPWAFGSRYEDTAKLSDSEWEQRIADALGPDQIVLIAETPAGDWVGMMRAVRDSSDSEVAGIYSVWVHPDYRGRDIGVPDALLDGLVRWSAAQPGVETLELCVVENNERAIKFYRRHGFEPTGHSEPFEGDESLREIHLSTKIARRASPDAERDRAVSG